MAPLLAFGLCLHKIAKSAQSKHMLLLPVYKCTSDQQVLFCTVLLDTASKLIHLIHSTEFPYTSFAVLETGTCLVADSGFDSLLTKLKTFYTPRKTSKIEVHLCSPRNTIVGYAISLLTYMYTCFMDFPQGGFSKTIFLFTIKRLKDYNYKNV